MVRLLGIWGESSQLSVALACKVVTLLIAYLSSHLPVGNDRGEAGGSGMGVSGGCVCGEGEGGEEKNRK
jgi:hypothetical protein